MYLSIILVISVIILLFIIYDLIKKLKNKLELYIEKYNFVLKYCLKNLEYDQAKKLLYEIKKVYGEY